MKTVTVHVTPDHINRGRRHQSQECPLALALGDATGCRASVGLSSFGLYRPDPLVPELLGDPVVSQAQLPPAAQGFPAAFDQGREVEPFSFELELPDDLELVA